MRLRNFAWLTLLCSLLSGAVLAADVHHFDSDGVNMAEDVRRLLDHLDIERAHVVGYSMGGKIANTFRTRHPQRVVTLTLGGYGWPWRGQAATLSIVGTEDTAVSRDNVNTLRETMAHVEAVDMPGTHAGPDGALYKAEFGDEVISFIRRNSH